MTSSLCMRVTSLSRFFPRSPSNLCLPLYETQCLIMANCRALQSNSITENKSVSTINDQYEEAIKALNGLQTNASVLEEIRKQRKIFMSNNVFETEHFLNKVGVTVNDLDKLPVIHLAGTKGKGSTCAFIESILKEHGLKTGFYSSPHLVAVRERIRINGLPIAKKEFSHYFWEVYEILQSKKNDEQDMPAYFKFLTVLALKIFLKEEVDVAIIEVGIGGEFDCTNVVRNPVVCGITSLDIDHTSCLGDTIDKIAWHKAGIIKSGVPAFTVVQQPSQAMEVILERAKEKESTLFVAPPLENYGWRGQPIQLGLSGYVQFLNASLALQLSRYFLKKTLRIKDNVEKNIDDICGKPFFLSEEDLFGLQNVVWPGRSQVLLKGRIAFFLDGAHTLTSIQSCIQWYKKVSQLHGSSSESEENVYRILVFNLTGDRDHQLILEKLSSCNFDAIIFTTNLVTKNMNDSSDQRNFTVSEAQQIARCQKLRKFWLQLSKQSSNEEELREISSKCLTFQCIKDVLDWIYCEGNCVIDEVSTPQKLKEAVNVQVLVTGSLHLVGGFLAVLDPSLSQLTRDNEVKELGITSMVDFVKRNYQHSNYSTPGAP